MFWILPKPWATLLSSCLLVYCTIHFEECVQVLYVLISLCFRSLQSPVHPIVLDIPPICTKFLHSHSLSKQLRGEIRCPVPYFPNDTILVGYRAQALSSLICAFLVPTSSRFFYDIKWWGASSAPGVTGTLTHNSCRSKGARPLRLTPWDIKLTSPCA